MAATQTSDWARPSPDADPGAAYHAQDLREHKIARAQRTMKMVISGITLGHDAEMFAQKRMSGRGKRVGTVFERQTSQSKMFFER
jgi:hypothetical protein